MCLWTMACDRATKVYFMGPKVRFYLTMHLQAPPTVKANWPHPQFTTAHYTSIIITLLGLPKGILDLLQS